MRASSPDERELGKMLRTSAAPHADGMVTKTALSWIFKTGYRLRR